MCEDFIMFKNKRKCKEFVGRRQQYRRVQKAVSKIFAVDITNRIPWDNVTSTSNKTDYLLNKLDTDDIITTNNDISNNEENDTACFNLHDNDLSINTVSNVSSEHLSNSLHTDTSSVSYDQNCLTHKLINWATKRQISQLAVTELLHILSPYPELPLHSRTLLQTPTSTVITNFETGEFCHLGLNVALENVLSQPYAKKYLEYTDTLQISFNIDGIS